MQLAASARKVHVLPCQSFPVNTGGIECKLSAEERLERAQPLIAFHIDIAHPNYQSRVGSSFHLAAGKPALKAHCCFCTMQIPSYKLCIVIVISLQVPLSLPQPLSLSQPAKVIRTAIATTTATASTQYPATATLQLLLVVFCSIVPHPALWSRMHELSFMCFNHNVCCPWQQAQVCGACKESWKFSSEGASAKYMGAAGGVLISSCGFSAASTTPRSTTL